MALMLQEMPGTLDTLASQLKGERQIHNLMNKLIYHSTLVTSMYVDLFQTQGYEVLKKKQELLLVQHPTQVDVQNLQSTLDTFKAGLCAAKLEMKSFEHKMHSVIEDCNSRHKESEESITQEEVHMTDLSCELTAHEKRIEECSKAATKNDEEAADFNRQAASLERKKEDAEKRATVSGVVGSAAAIIFAPFSGGASLALLGATAGMVGASLADAGNLRNKAKHFESIAKSERDNADKARTKVSELREKISTCRKSIKRSQLNRRNLLRTSETLDLIHGCLLSYISLMNQAEVFVQDLETNIHAAITEGLAFEVIQQALSECPLELDDAAHEAMFELRNKWKALEREIRGTAVG